MTDEETLAWGRLLIINGRAWLALTPTDIERGARAVIADPHYRAEIGRSAVRHTDEIGDRELSMSVLAAWNGLDELDGGDKRCGHCFPAGFSR